MFKKHERKAPSLDTRGPLLLFFIFISYFSPLSLPLPFFLSWYSVSIAVIMGARATIVIVKNLNFQLFNCQCLFTKAIGEGVGGGTNDDLFHHHCHHHPWHYHHFVCHCLKERKAQELQWHGKELLAMLGFCGWQLQQRRRRNLEKKKKKGIKKYK